MEAKEFYFRTKVRGKTPEIYMQQSFRLNGLTDYLSISYRLDEDKATFVRCSNLMSDNLYEEMKAQSKCSVTIITEKEVNFIIENLDKKKLCKKLMR